jgi:hypothetical protein
MAAERLPFEQRKIILKRYWKFENMCEVRKQWPREFATEPPTRLTMARIHDKFEDDGTVHKQKIWEDLHSNESRPFCYDVGTVDTIRTKSANQCVRGTEIS